MMGVHGNGLTSLLWMTPTPQSTVIEFFCPSGFAFDVSYGHSRALLSGTDFVSVRVDDTCIGYGSLWVLEQPALHLA
jgi:hypothetical protein